MESYLQENFGVKPKHSSTEALEKWRNLCGVVKNPKRRFRFTANLSKRYEAAAMRKTNQVPSYFTIEVLIVNFLSCMRLPNIFFHIYELIKRLFANHDRSSYWSCHLIWWGVRAIIIFLLVKLNCHSDIVISWTIPKKGKEKKYILLHLCHFFKTRFSTLLAKDLFMYTVYIYIRRWIIYLFVYDWCLITNSIFHKFISLDYL